MALLVAEEAATLVASGYRSRPRTMQKGRNDLVTEYDKASEDLLIARLGSLSPGIRVIGEETGGGRPSASSEALVWYVDPVDGTTNFAHGHPFWCVSVGLMERNLPVAGAVVAAALGVRWVGWVYPTDPSRPTRGEPGGEPRGSAFRNGKPCSVSGTQSVSEALLATGFPAVRDNPPHDNFASFLSVKRSSRAVRRCGAAAIDLCMVADGTYDGYWERRLYPWDTAAGVAILTAAGGIVTSLDGSKPDYFEGSVVATNGLIHADVVKGISS
jgi:myo-inositol-1(or 4)-monophosphatase